MAIVQVEYSICKILFIVCLLSTPVYAGVSFDPNFIYSPVEAPKSPLDSTWNATDVSLANGSARRNYSLSVPPGTTQATTPSLQLILKNQRRGNVGLLDLSWDIPMDFIGLDDKGTSNYPNDDEYFAEFGGAREKLISVGGNKYRQEHDNATRFTLASDSSWLVEYPDGRVMEFGKTSDSAYMANSKTSTIQFRSRSYLNKTTDSNGNTIVHSYRQNPFSGDDGVIYIDQIRYGFGLKHQINFVYQPRPVSEANAPFVEYGSYMIRTQRLKQINMTSAGEYVRGYRFSYVPNSVGTRELVSLLEEIGDDQSSTQDVLRLAYNPIDLSFSSTPETWTPNSHWLRHTDDDADLVRDIFDINCDSLPDLVSYEDDGTNRFEIKVGLPGGKFSNDVISWPIPADDVDQLRDVVGEDGKAPDVHGTFIHANGDQCIDYVHANGNVEIYLNNGSGLNFNREIIPPYHAKIDDAQRPSDTKAPNVRNGVRMFNNDPFPDLVRRIEDGDYWEIYYGTETGGFISGGTWNGISLGWLTDLERDDGDTESTFFDFNGDGYLDYVINNSDGRRIFINTGSTFVEIDCYNCSNIDDDLVDTDESGNVSVSALIDINADGIPDDVDGNSGSRSYNVKFGTGNGYTDEMLWTYGHDIPADGYIRDQSPDDDSDRTRTRRDFIDMDGDGDVDIARKTGDGMLVYRNNAQYADLISSITELTGGSTALSYRVSNQPYNDNVNPNPELPFGIKVVDSRTLDNGLSDDHKIHVRYDYEYRGGLYDGVEREFTAFRKVTVHRPDAAREDRHFHQDLAKRGKEFKSELIDASDTLFSKQETQWTVNLPFTDVFQVVPTRTTTSQYDGLATPRIIQVNSVYDEFINETKRIEHGDLAVADDSRITDSIFASISGKYIKNRPAQVTIKDSAGAVLRKQTNTYENKGNRIQLEEFRDDGLNPITTWTYNAQGLESTITDPGDATTTTEYDSVLKQYPEIISNDLNHQIEREYDLGSGKVTKEIAANGGITLYDYDPFKRLHKSARPRDTLASPTQTILYEINGMAPEKVTTINKGQVGQETTRTFVDGFGFVVQERINAENGQQAVTEHFWDDMGRYAGLTIPQFKSSSSNYVDFTASLPTNPLRSHLQYDVGDRLVKFNNPDTTDVEQIYLHEVITRKDEHETPKDFVVDAYNQVQEIIEYNIGEQYRTLFDINVVGDLNSVTDTLGNQTTFTMNSLGWFMGVDHSSMGQWSYLRNAMGNVIEQTDSRSITRLVEYDEIHRPIWIDHPNDPDIVMVYDENGDTMAMTSYTSVAGIVNRDYDERLQKISEIRELDGLSWIMQWQHDSQDRVIAMTYPDGETVNYTRNIRGLVESVQGDQPLLTDQNYDASGLNVNSTFANGLQTTRAYDQARLWLTQLTTAGLQDISYTQDSLGNPITINDAVEGRLQSFDYDALSRLLSATEADSARTFSYSPIHTLSSVTINSEPIQYGYSVDNPYFPSSVTTDDTLVPQRYRN